MLNKVILAGNLGRDPELRYSQSGTPVCTLHLATNERFTTSAGEVQERTTWHRVVTFGKQAESCAEFLKKGRAVLVEGRIQNRQYEDRDGVTRYVSEIVANSVKFLTPNGNGSKSNSSGKNEQKEPEQEVFNFDIP